MQHKFDIIIPPQDIDFEPGLQNKLAAGDKDAFAWVYKNYSKKVYSYVLLITNNETISEDIVQDVFVKLWQHKEKLRNHENFNGYFRLLYKNHVMNVLRNDSRERKSRIDYFKTTTQFSNSVDEIINYKETKRLIVDGINGLPKKSKFVFELSRDHGMKHEEIARTLNKTSKTVRNQLHTAMKCLKERMK